MLRYGGRSTFILSAESVATQRCAMEDSCMIEQCRDDHVLWIECGTCLKEIHNFCDKKLRKSKQVPEVYTCPLCSK